jgi:hypothetical protein
LLKDGLFVVETLLATSLPAVPVNPEFEALSARDVASNVSTNGFLIANPPPVSIPPHLRVK